jgi:CubicO group peptidase (beta-lactamase class C family)
MRPRRAALAVLASLIAAAAAAERVPPPRFADPARRQKLAAALPEIEKVFANTLARQKLPGLAFGVVIDGELVFGKGYGVRDVAATAPVDADTVFRIASMTKSFTALAILKLRDEGRLSLDDPASKYVPEMARLAPATADSPAITIRHLLTHSEGFPEDNPWGDRQLARSDATLGRWIEGGIPFSNAPGVAFEYSNYGFAILGRIVARASGMRYRDYVDAHILRPLGMTATTWEAASVPPDRLARGYRADGDGWQEEPALADGSFGAMGGLFSSVRDLARYTSFFLSAWPPRDDPEAGPLRRSSVREMQQAWRFSGAGASRDTVEAPLRFSTNAYGYGLTVAQSCRFRFVVSHGGGLPGFGSVMRWLPEHGVAIVALANLTYAGPGRAANEALEALHRTGALRPRVVQPSPALLAASDGVTRLIERWDDALLDSLAADNLLLDTPRDKRKARLAELHDRLGACRPEGEIDAENALRGRWKLACDKGHAFVSITLAPTMPPRVQSLVTTFAPALSPAQQRVVDRIAALMKGGDPGKDARVAEQAMVRGDYSVLVRAIDAAAAWGECRPGEVRRGDGETQAVVRLECAGGHLDADLAIDKASGRLKSLRLVPAGDDTCVP